MRIFLISVSLAFTFVAQPALAAKHAALEASGKPDMGKGSAGVDQRSMAEKAADIARVEEYLSSITSIVSDFSQTSTDGSTGKGKFFLKRPGKMRWQYSPPTPLLLVSDGKTVTYYDAGLDQISYIGIDDTLAGFLTKKVIKLDNDSIKLTGFEAVNGTIRATVVQRKKPSEGSLTLELSDKPMELNNIIAVDATGNETRVKLDHAQFGPVLDDKLFIFEDPRGVNHKRNKR